MKKAPVICIVAAVFVVTSYAIWSFARPAHAVGFGERIRHDDFLFSVEGARRAPRGDASIVSVDVLVVNQAKRVGYEWRDSIAYLTDDRGTRYGSESDGTYEIAPGNELRRTVRFRVPRDAANLSLHFWDGVFMGDALDGVAYAKTYVPLPAISRTSPQR
jgi:hypothetical protein